MFSIENLSSNLQHVFFKEFLAARQFPQFFYITPVARRGTVISVFILLEPLSLPGASFIILPVNFSTYSVKTIDQNYRDFGLMDLKEKKRTAHPHIAV
jgi:hypothetical protein